MTERNNHVVSFYGGNTHTEQPPENNGWPRSTAALLGPSLELV